MKKMIKCLLSGLLVTAMLVLSIPAEVKASQLISVPIMLEQDGQTAIVNWPATLGPDGSPVINQLSVSNSGKIIIPSGTIVNNAVLKSIEEITTYDSIAETALYAAFYNAVYTAACDALKNNHNHSDAVNYAVRAAREAARDAVPKALDAGLNLENIQRIANQAAREAAKNAGLDQDGQNVAAETARRTAEAAVLVSARRLKYNDKNSNQGVHIENCIVLSSNFKVSDGVNFGFLRTSGTIDPTSSFSAWKVESIGPNETEQIKIEWFDTEGVPPVVPPTNSSESNNEEQKVVQEGGGEAEIPM